MRLMHISWRGWSIVFASVVTVASGAFISQFQHTAAIKYEFNERILWVHPLSLHQL